MGAVPSRAGRRRAVPARPFGARVLAGSMVGPVYALPIAVISVARRGCSWRTGGSFVSGTVGFDGVVWQAFALPALLGVGRRGSRRELWSPAPPMRGSVHGSWAAGGCCWPRSGSPPSGVLVLAAVRPQGTGDVRAGRLGERARVGRAARSATMRCCCPTSRSWWSRRRWADARRSRDPEGPIPLAVPRPLAGARRPASSSRRRAGDVRADDRRRTRRIAPMPPGYWVFLLVPAIATVRRRSFGGRTGAAGRADVSASCEARARVWCSRCWWASGVDGECRVGPHVERRRGSHDVVHAGTEPVPTALLALVWGVVGGALGAWLRAVRRRGRRFPSNPMSPCPPSPTSV